MNKLVVVGLSIALSACSNIDNSEYVLDYFEHDNGTIVGNSLAFSLYRDIINEAYYDAFGSSKSLKSNYNIDYRNSIGDQVSSSSYSISDEINKALKKCSTIKFDKGDIVSTVGRWDILGRMYSSSFDYKIANKEKIKKIQSCADNVMAESPLDLDILARFTADDRFGHYLSSDLNSHLVLIKSDGKLTFKELVSAYKVLDKNIEININSSFMKSN